MTSDSNTKSTNKDWSKISIYWAVANAVVTAIILASPIGLGDGNGVIGYSVVRALIMICPQSIIALAGLKAAFWAFRKRQSWLPGLNLNALVMIATFFLYFAQSRTIERLL